MIRRALPEELAICQALRRRVFIEEQAVPEADELDGRDGEAIHLLVFDGANPVGTARLMQDETTGKIGRVCILAEMRGRGLGADLIRAAVAEFRATPGVIKVKLGAQVHALAFYERLGFVGYGADYLDAGILHRDMALAL